MLPKMQVLKVAFFLVSSKKNVKQYLTSFPTLVSRYVSLDILSEKTFTVGQCFSPDVQL